MVTKSNPSPLADCKSWDASAISDELLVASVIDRWNYFEQNTKHGFKIQDVMRKQQVQRLEHTFFLDDVTTETNQTTSIVFTYVWFVECVGPQ